MQAGVTAQHSLLVFKTPMDIWRLKGVCHQRRHLSRTALSLKAYPFHRVNFSMVKTGVALLMPVQKEA